VLLGDDVLDVKCQQLVLILMKPAVFTTAAGSLPDESS